MFNFDFTPKQKLAAFALIGLSAIGLSLAFAKNSGSFGGGVTLKEPSSGVIASDSDAIGGSEANGVVVVHVSGAVNSPNVYTLQKGKRVLDAINAAGGASSDADTESLNLAEKLQDGSKIVVPSKYASQTATPSAYSDSTYTNYSSSDSPEKPSKSNKFKRPGEGFVSLNSASSEQLQRLPGVGPATAQKIIAYRTQIGRFSNIDQLMDVSGIGPKKFSKMQPFVRL